MNDKQIQDSISFLRRAIVVFQENSNAIEKYNLTVDELIASKILLNELKKPAELRDI